MLDGARPSVAGAARREEDGEPEKHETG
jgi:hypothetical protein